MSIISLSMSYLSLFVFLVNFYWGWFIVQYYCRCEYRIESSNEWRQISFNRTLNPWQQVWINSLPHAYKGIIGMQWLNGNISFFVRKCILDSFFCVDGIRCIKIRIMYILSFYNKIYTGILRTLEILYMCARVFTLKTQQNNKKILPFKWFTFA